MSTPSSVSTIYRATYASSIRSDSVGIRAPLVRPCLQALLEPVVRVRLVAERGDLAVAAAPVQRDRLLQAPVRLQPHDPDPGLAGVPLQLPEQPPAQPEPAC